MSLKWSAFSLAIWRFNFQFRYERQHSSSRSHWCSAGLCVYVPKMFSLCALLVTCSFRKPGAPFVPTTKNKRVVPPGFIRGWYLHYNLLLQKTRSLEPMRTTKKRQSCGQSGLALRWGGKEISSTRLECAINWVHVGISQPRPSNFISHFPSQATHHHHDHKKIFSRLVLDVHSFLKRDVIVLGMQLNCFWGLKFF